MPELRRTQAPAPRLPRLRHLQRPWSGRDGRRGRVRRRGRGV